MCDMISFYREVRLWGELLSRMPLLSLDLETDIINQEVGTHGQTSEAMH